MEPAMQTDLPSPAAVVLDLQDPHVLSWSISVPWTPVHTAFVAALEPATDASVSLVCTKLHPLEIF